MKTILIFDDDPGCAENAEQLHRITGYRVEFISMNGESPINSVYNATQKFDSVDLVIVDHFLTNTLNAEIAATGPIIVPNIRRRWPAVPVFAVTAAPEKCSAEQSSDVYEEVFDVDTFSELIAFIPAVLSGYDVINNCRSVAEVTDAMDSGEISSSVFEAMPTCVRKGIGDSRFGNDFYRWMRRHFYKLPGFLLNREWTAVNLGIAVEYFDLYRDKLENALYTGPFAVPSDQRWWKHRVSALVLPDDESRYSVSIPEAALTSLHIDPKHASKCERCGEIWPEVLGLTDESPHESNLVTLHRRCSESHSKYRPEPFYEELRVMIGD